MVLFIPDDNDDEGLRTPGGSTLSRCGRKRLSRAVTNAFCPVAMSVFVSVPFVEPALPFAIKLFPTLLPTPVRNGPKEEK